MRFQATARAIAQPQFAVDHVGQLPRDRQAQAGAAAVAVARAFEPVERLQHGLQFVLGNAGAAVQHADRHAAAIVGRANLDLSRAAEFQRVVDQVAENPAQRARARLPRAGAVYDEDVAKSISTIFLFNVLAAFLFPAAGMALGMSDQGFGMWAGTAVNDTSSVVAAATTWSSAVGNDTALTLATIVKLTRTLAIIPITFILALYRSRKEKEKSKGNFRLSKIFPWFILFFLLAAVIRTVTGMPAAVSKPIVSFGKILITMAMAAIGLNTNLVSLIKNGGKPIFLGLCCWAAVAFASLGMQILLHLW